MTILDWFFLVGLILLAIAIWSGRMDHRWTAPKDPQPEYRSPEYYEWRRKQDNPYEHVFGILTPISVIILLISLVAAGVMKLNEKTCRDKAHGMDRGYEWDSYTGCLFELDNGQFIPEKNFRVTENGELSEVN